MYRYKSKNMIFFALFIGLSLILSSCVVVNAPDSSTDVTDQVTADTSTSDENTGEFSESYEFTPEDEDSSWNKNSTTSIAFEETSADISGKGAVFSENTLTISQAGTYVLSGSLKNGQILINAGKNDVVRLVLNGVSLHNDSGPAIYALKSGKVVLILESGTQNTVSDGADYAATGSDDPNAAIYIQDDLSITGKGQLSVTGNYKHGIRTQDYLVITDGTIAVTAVGDALRGRDGIAIHSGNITLKAGSDGMQSNNDTDDAKGFVIIYGGTFNISAGNDGIQAESSLTISGGDFHINTGGGSDNAPTRGNNFGGDPGRGQPPREQQPVADTESMKGIKAEKLIDISGGNFIIDAQDDGLHSNKQIKISNGVLNIKSGDDGIHADENITISSGEITIEKSYEGIESATIDIVGGTISIKASDDGINASDGSATGFGGRPGDSNNALYVRISGGEISINADADGVDSNGNMFFEGGYVYIVGSSDPESALDADGTITVSGGTVIGIGSVGHMEAPAESSTQPSLMIIFSGEQAASTMIMLKDESGNVVFEGTSEKRFRSFLFTDSTLIKGSQYTLFINGSEKATIKLTSALTICSETGGAVSRSPGGRPGQGGRR